MIGFANRFPYAFLRGKLYFLPPPPYESFEETGTYIKINNNIYAENGIKTYSSYKFQVNKRGGENAEIVFQYPVDYINLGDKVEYYLYGKLKYAGYVEFIDGASKRLSIIPLWGRLNYQYIAGGQIVEEFEKGALDIIKDMKSFIVQCGIIWKDEEIDADNTVKISMEYGAKNVAEILDAVESELSSNYCWGVDFNNVFFFKQINDEPKRTINWFNNDFSESEYEKDTSDIITRYICTVKTKVNDEEYTRVLPVEVGNTDKYPPIELERTVGIKYEIFSVDTVYYPDQYDAIYDRAYQMLKYQKVPEKVKLKNVNRNYELNFNEALKIIMKPDNNFYSTTELQNKQANQGDYSNNAQSDIIAVDVGIDYPLGADKFNEKLISFFESREYKVLALKGYSIEKIVLYFKTVKPEEEPTGVFFITDGEKSQRKQCVDGFGLFDVSGYDKINLKVLAEKDGILFVKAMVFYNAGVHEFVMNTRAIKYEYKNNNLTIDADLAKMDTKFTNYLFKLDQNTKRVQQGVLRN